MSFVYTFDLGLHVYTLVLVVDILIAEHLEFCMLYYVFMACLFKELNNTTFVP